MISEDVIPLNETGECVLTACYYVDDPDNRGNDNDFYLADHKPTCTFGQLVCLEISKIIMT